MVKDKGHGQAGANCPGLERRHGHGQGHGMVLFIFKVTDSFTVTNTVLLTDTVTLPTRSR